MHLIGYTYLIEKFDLKVLPHFCTSYARKGRRKSEFVEGIEVRYYPLVYAPKTLFGHLEFALKHEGVNLQILSQLFPHLPEKELTSFIEKKPLSKPRRKLWFFYEFLTQKKLPISDLQKGPYVDLLDASSYFTSARHFVKRYRVADNLLGSALFCPIVRKSPQLKQFKAKQLRRKIESLLDKYESALLLRAATYLYAKETRSSFEIERVEPSKTKATRFCDLLQKAHQKTSLSKKWFLELQHAIVDAKSAASEYRNFQNYIGHLSRKLEQIIDYIPPLPEDVSSLMNGLIASFDRMVIEEVAPIVIATVISFGFVFIHPFEDGNGRIHRFLIHQIFSLTNVVPKNMIFPISATMLRNIEEYDAALESLSRPLMKLLENHFQWTDQGEVSVQLQSSYLYRYLDFTQLVEYLAKCYRFTVEEEFEKELTFLKAYDQAKAAIQKTTDLPARKIDLLIKCVSQNRGRLAARKRKAHFPELPRQKIKDIENILQRIMDKSALPKGGGQEGIFGRPSLQKARGKG